MAGKAKAKKLVEELAKRAGFGDELAIDRLNKLAVAQKAELLKRASQGDELAMDTASRMARAKGQGYTKTYHGTTKNIPESGFDMGGYAQSDLGQGIYATTDPYDASFNYADPDTSQDLIGKIDRRAEHIADELDIGYEEATIQARKELVDSPQVLQTMSRTENPVRIGGDETQFNLMADADIEATWDNASEQIAEQYADDIAEGAYDADEIKELTEDLARELAYENDYVDEPKIYESLRNVAHRFDDVDIEQAIGELSEQGYESLGAEELIDALKGTEGIQYATSQDTGDMASGELIRQAFEDAGYDSIIDATPNKKWGSESGRANFMPELEGTDHVIVFNPNQMRSVNATFDPAKRKSSNLLASLPALAVGAGAMSQSDDSSAMSQLLGEAYAKDQNTVPVLTDANDLTYRRLDSIVNDEAPRAEAAANFIDKWTQTPIGSPLEGTSNYLRNLGSKRTMSQRQWDAIGIGLDLM